MDAHLGFEHPTYPGDKTMADLFEAVPLAWCALPLGAEPAGTPGSWSAKVPLLRSIGWGVAPLYAAQLDPERGPLREAAQQGRADAVQAAHRAIRANLVDGDVLYLDVPDTGTLPEPLVAYCDGWFDELSTRTSFRPGARCSHAPAATQLRELHPEVLVWVVNTARHRAADAIGADGVLLVPDLAECGYPEAVAWQFLPAALTLPFLSAEGDATSLGPLALAVALVADPSRPGGGGPPVGGGRWLGLRSAPRYVRA